MTHRFQSTPPSRGGDSRLSSCFPLSSQFQSTPPARGATAAASMSSDPACNFNPRPPRGGRPRQLEAVCKRCHISIHAPREGGDLDMQVRMLRRGIFQSTPPARGATVTISTDGITLNDFNPRPPRGGRLLYSSGDPDLWLISIHAPREGGDPDLYVQRPDGGHFNPRPPRGGRRYNSTRTEKYPHFNPRPPRGGRPIRGHRLCRPLPISIHAPREGGDPEDPPTTSTSW